MRVDRGSVALGLLLDVGLLRSQGLKEGSSTLPLSNLTRNSEYLQEYGVAVPADNKGTP